MVDPLRCLALQGLAGARRVACHAAMLVFGAWTAAAVGQQPPEVHYWHQGVMPPGAIGGVRLQRGGPVAGYFQPVRISAAAGTLIALAEQGVFGEPMPAPATAGLLVGAVYRFRVMNIPSRPGAELFPTVEVIDRLYPPLGQEAMFPIEIELTEEELALALDGKFVTRVIYLEDPDKAIPAVQDPGRQAWFEAGAGRDPLAMADELGRPVAILRIGGRMPDDGAMPDAAFLFGCPPAVKYVRPVVYEAPQASP